MDFCTTYFNTSIYELDQDDLKRFFQSPRKENTHLEFKQYNPNTKKSDLISIFNDAICSFLNSEGGILIYGAPIRQKDTNGKEFYQGELTPFPGNVLPDKDDLIRQIAGNIHYMPSGIKYEPVKFGEGWIGVFEVQESLSKPHQTANKYQIRLDAQKALAPHYLIVAMMRQTVPPRLTGKIIFQDYVRRRDNHTFNLKIVLGCTSDVQNAHSVEAKVFYATFSERQMQFVSRIPFVTKGLTEIVSHRLEISNHHFVGSNSTEFEFAVVFCGTNTTPRISYYKMKLRDAPFKAIIQENFLVTSDENLEILEFVEKYPHQRILEKH